MENRPPNLTRRVKYHRVYVAPSFCGEGLFAAASFRAYQPVGRISGEIKPPGYRSDYCMGFRDGAIEPDRPYRMINHSCDPNCELIEWEITDEETGDKFYELWLHTVRAVAKDEELTIDYGWEKEAAIPCLCGSPKCRGWVCRLTDLDACIQERGKGSLEEKREEP